MYIHAIKKLCETPLSKHCSHTMDCTYRAMCVCTRQGGSTVPLTAVLNIMRWVVERLSLQFKHDALPVHSWRGSIKSSSVTVTFFIIHGFTVMALTTHAALVCVCSKVHSVFNVYLTWNPAYSWPKEETDRYHITSRGYVYVWLKTV